MRAPKKILEVVTLKCIIYNTYAYSRKWLCGQVSSELSYAIYSPRFESGVEMIIFSKILSIYVVNYRLFTENYCLP